MRSLALLAAIGTTAACTASSDAAYTCMESLLSGAITVHWKLSADETSMSVMAVSTGSGYLGLGFGTSMSSSTGAIIAQDGSAPALHDINGRTRPQLATSDSVGYTDLSQMRAGGTTTVKFTRPTQGLSLSQATMITAYHLTSETLVYHTARTPFTAQLNASPPTPSSTNASPPTTPPPRAATPPPTAESAPAPGGCTQSTLKGGSEEYACEVEMGGGAGMHFGGAVRGQGRKVALAMEGTGSYSLAWPENAGLMAPASALVVEDSNVRRVRITGKSSAAIANDNSVLPDIEDVAVTTVNGKRVLSFRIAETQTSRRGASVLSGGQQNVVNFNWAANPGTLAYHGGNKGSRTVDFERGTATSVVKVPGKVKVHAIFMLVLWGVLAPCGVLVKRFGALCMPGNTPYFAHGGIMVVVVLATTVMAALAFSDLRGGSAHKGLGVTVFAVMWVQVILAAGKAALGQDASTAKYVGLGHAVLGSAVHILAVAQMLVGARDYNDRFPGDDLGDDIKWAVIAFAVSFVVANIGGYLLKAREPEAQKAPTDTEPTGDAS
eukprot:TRINITY_DN4158_c0_g2_i9.p1 TRINITY_DN4158_c0_g2~~TRINITY_DN4158_c0_g2_i9.p1  ORF type:complete len:551 (+),score=110.55 TRINITY_DN4158_c0_g2_i9:79-1731(+)